VCALMPQRARLLINSRPVHLMIVLRHGDHVDIDGDSGRFAEIPQGRPDSREVPHLPPCLYCGAAHEADHLVYQCPLCHAVYHDDCWARLFDKRCCSRACPFVPEAEVDHT
jgi:hypothetical protein